jgi:hypothetical protein
VCHPSCLVLPVVPTVLTAAAVLQTLVVCVSGTLLFSAELQCGLVQLAVAVQLYLMLTSLFEVSGSGGAATWRVLWFSTGKVLSSSKGCMGVRCFCSC